MLPRLLRRRRRPAPAPPEVAEAVSRKVSAAVDSCEGSRRLGHPFLRQARGAGGFLTLIGLWGGFVAQVAVAREAADVVVKEVSPPLRGAKPSTLAEAVEVPDEAVGEAADVAANDESLLLSKEVKASTTPSAVVAADEAVTDASPVEELRCV